MGVREEDSEEDIGGPKKKDVTWYTKRRPNAGIREFYASPNIRVV